MVQITARKRTQSKVKRICSECKKDKTAIGVHRRKRKDGTIGEYSSECWYRDSKAGWYCYYCYLKLVAHPKHNPCRFEYKYKRLHSSIPQKSGVCNFCRAVVGQVNVQTDKLCQRTNMAHFEYDDNNPEAHRLELCIPCHAKYDRAVPEDRKCYDCDSNTTVKGKDGRVKWYKVKGLGLENEFRCNTCYVKERGRNKKNN
jgi:hypothetical protein